MQEFDTGNPVYFDGSKHAAEESSLSPSEEVSGELAASDEWRRYIGTNPYGFGGQ